jgi:TPR repeat protein
MIRKPFLCTALLMLLSVTVCGEPLSRFQTAMIDAEKNNPEAQNKVGTYYEIGIGTEQNYIEAIRWYRAAAKQGFSRAQFNLGEMYEEGKGVAKNMGTALSWYKKACRNGWKGACRKYLPSDGLSDCGCD